MDNPMGTEFEFEQGLKAFEPAEAQLALKMLSDPLQLTRLLIVDPKYGMRILGHCQAIVTWLLHDRGIARTDEVLRADSLQTLIDHPEMSDMVTKEFLDSLSPDEIAKLPAEMFDGMDVDPGQE